MAAKKLGNIPLRTFRKFLLSQELNLIKTSKGRGGHEKWSKIGLDRPITIQTHVDPVPQFIVQQVLRHLVMSRSQFDKAIEGL